MGLLFGSRPTKDEAAAELKAAKANMRKAERAEAALNVARPGTVMDYPESDQLLDAEERLKKAKRVARWAR